ncbi:MAG TPA: hypothetical protein VEB66_12310 [Opitutaceae bacterium]|nr:hypothetical protein [Opitutaceae bacterium]
MKRPSVVSRSPAWWLWLAAAALLVTARLAEPWAGVVALGLFLAQVIGFYMRENSWDSLAVQVRVVFAAVVFTGHLPHLGPLLWLPAAAAATIVLLDYCVVSRVLSLMAMHRTEPLDLALLRRTFSPAWAGPRPGAAPSLRLRTASPFS